MRPQSCKAKGRRFQQRVCKLLLGAYPSLEPDDVRSTSMGAAGEDVLLSPAAQRLFPYTIECKNCENLNLMAAYRQSAAHSVRVGRAPVVFFARNHSKTYVAVGADTAHALPLHTGAAWKVVEAYVPPFRYRGGRKSDELLDIWLAIDWLAAQASSGTEAPASIGVSTSPVPLAETLVTVNPDLSAASVPAAAPR